MFSIGSAIKQARISKGFTQKQLAEGILSVSQLSKFENGLHDITLTKCFLLLERLHLDLAEFYEVYLTKDDSVLHIDFDFTNHLLHKKEIEIKYQLGKEIEKNENANKVYTEHRLIIMKQILRIKQELPLDNYEIEKIYSYLESISEWGLYEMSLLSNSLFIFNRHQIMRLIKISLKQMYRYIHRFQLPYYKEWLLITLQSLCLKLILEGEYGEATRVAEETASLIQSHYSSKCYILQKYIKGYLLLNTEQNKKGTLLIQESKDLTLKVGDLQLGKLMEVYETFNKNKKL